MKSGRLLPILGGVIFALGICLCNERVQAQDYHTGNFPSGSATNASDPATGNRSLMVTYAGDQTVVSQPGATTAPSASIGAGAAGVRHVATGAIVCISAVAAQGDIIFNLRDGATGAGTIKATWRLQAPIGTSKCDFLMGPASIVGTAATAMTLESAAAPASTNFATATLIYHDAK